MSAPYNPQDPYTQFAPFDSGYTPDLNAARNARSAALVEYEGARKKGVVAWLLWLFTGGLGGHRFYLGHTGYAIAMLLLNWVTLGIWALIDAFFINRHLRSINRDRWVTVAVRYGAPIDPFPEGAY